MKESIKVLIRKVWNQSSVWIPVSLGLLSLAIAAVSWETWSPEARLWLLGPPGEKTAEVDESGPADVIRISDQAKRTLNLKVDEVRLGEFTRMVEFPAMVVKLTGTTHVEIAAPLTGVITEMAVVGGEAVWSDTLLFRMKLSHEDLVRLQTDFLRTLGQLDAELQEITRLRKIVGGGVAEEVVLRREYERNKLQAVLRAQEESLGLHGLSQSQIDSIKSRRRLAREIIVVVPRFHDNFSIHHDRESNDKKPTADKAGIPQKTHPGQRRRFVVESLQVHLGQSVKAGATLCTLADYRELHIAGRAFEQDAPLLTRVAKAKLPITAIPELKAGFRSRISNLPIVHLDNRIDTDSRALHFHVSLPNKIVSDIERAGRRYLAWKFKPGQRMQLRIPVETWKNVIVLPVDAVAQEGPESYVFREDGKTFNRQPVAVRYRDSFQIVIEYDGAISPGERVAFNGAHQLLIALKSKAGGGKAQAHGHPHPHPHPHP